MSRLKFWKSSESPGLTSLNELLYWVKQRGAAPLLCSKRNGTWVSVTARAFYDCVRQAGAALLELGLQPGDRVAILSESRPEWMMADFACLSRGLVDVPIYPTLTAAQVAYILRDSGARAVLVSSPEQAQKIEAERAQLPQLEWVIAFDSDGADGGVSWSQLVASGAEPAAREKEDDFDTALQATPEERLATLIYTSGTTGIPKGVMLTHGNLASNLNWSSVDFHFGDDERRLSLLPLSHITERHLGYVDFIFEQVTYYAETIEKVPENLLEVRPTFLVAVPRVFEKVAAKTRAEVAAKPAIVQHLFHWAREVGREMGPYWLDGWPTFGPKKRSRAGNAKVPPKGLRMKAAIADRLVYRKLRQRMGGQLNKAISGGAPLGKELAEFMLSLSIVIDQGYGLTETSPVIAINRPGQRRIGSVGRPLRIVEVTVAEDGELLVRGPSVFSGYWGLKEETAEVLRNGWFHTGDIGYLDDDGYIYITDRKKDLIKTSGGKFIAPQPIECRLKDSAWIGEAVLVGEKRKYVSALLVPNFPALEEYARHNGIEWKTVQELTASPEIRALFEAEVERINEGLARFETIKRFALLQQPFSIEGGEITPTIKVRRRTIELKYRDVIATLYDAE